MSRGCERLRLSGSLKRNAGRASRASTSVRSVAQGVEHRYEVTEAAMQAYAEATDDVSGGPVFAIVPVWNAIAPASEAVASGDVRRFVVHYEQDMLLHRPLEAGHASRLACDAGRGAAAPERDVARHQDGDARRGRRARERAVRDGVLPRGRRRTRESASGRPTTGSRSTATRRLRSRIASRRTRRSATRRRRATTSRSTSTTSSPGGWACRAGSSTGSARWRLRAGRSSRLRAWTTRERYGGSQCASPLLCSRVSRSRRVSGSSTARSDSSR